MNEPLYRIHWRANFTGETGHAFTAMPLDEAVKKCAELNRKFKDFYHWPEPVPPEESEA